MPQDSPQVGEVWIQGSTVAIIAEPHGDSGFRLLGRSRQSAFIATTSLKVLWKYVTLYDAACSYVGPEGPCPDRGLVISLDGKVCCEKHAPRHQPVLLPIDKPVELDNSFIQELFGTCPVCQTPAQARKSLWKLSEGYAVGVCSCRSSWIPLILPTLTDPHTNVLDTSTLKDNLSEALTLLIEKESCREIEAFYGTDSLATTECLSKFREAFDSVKGASIKTFFNPRFGKTIVMIIGTPHLEPGEREVLHQVLQLNSLWQGRKNSETIIRVVRIEKESKAVLCISPSSTDQFKYMAEKDLRRAFKRVLTYNTGRCPPTWNSRQFPNPLKLTPSVRDTWYFHEEQCYSRVTAVSEDNGLTVIEFIVPRGVKFTAPLDEFQREHADNQERSSWVIGKEYSWGPNHEQFGILVASELDDIKLERDNKQVIDINPKDFWGAKEVIRKTTLDRILEVSPFD